MKTLLKDRYAAMPLHEKTQMLKMLSFYRNGINYFIT